MHRSPTLLRLFPLLLASPLGAMAAPIQGELPVGLQHPAAMAGFGLVEQLGELSAQGPDYRAHFHPSGFEFVPVLGLLAPKEYPLVFELESIRRGDTPMAHGGEALPTRAEPFAVYQRGAVRERYEARVDGVELTFEFASLPAAGGDLVVRGRIDCELPARVEPSGSILFEAEGLGGIRIGTVLGIDAAGQRAVGSSRMDGNVLELRLPAEFVARAELPLILDPLIGTVQNIAGVKTDPQMHAAVTSNPTLVYAVAFEREFAANSIQIYGQQLDSSGVPIGAPVPISSAGGAGGGLHTAPRLGGIAGTFRYWVAWEYRPVIGGFGSIRVGELTESGAQPAAIQVPKNQLASDSQPAVGGGSASGAPTVLAFLRNENGQQRVLYCTLFRDTFPGGSGLTVTGPLQVVPAAGIQPAGVALSVGLDPFNLLLVYRIQVQSSPVRHQIHCRAMFPILGSEIPTVELGPALVINDPAVDFVDVEAAGGQAIGFWNGRWQLAVEVRAVQPPLGLQRVETIAVNMLNSATLQLLAAPRKPVSTSATAVSTRPSIAFTGAKYHISYAERPTAFGYRLRFAELDLTDAPARQLAIPSVGWSTPRHTAVAARWPMAAPFFAQYCGVKSESECDQGIVVWPVTSSPVNGAPGLQYSLFESLGNSGTAEPVGTACGHGQISASASPAVGHPDFRIELEGAALNPHPGFLNVTTKPGLAFSCGGCPVLMPELLTAAETVNGSASVSFKIPNQTALVGVQLAAQWLRFGLPGSLCPEVLGLGASNVLLVTVGE